MTGLLVILNYVVTFYAGILFVRFLAQWTRADYNNQIAQVVELLTQPVLKPLRNVLPKSNRFDWAALAFMALLIIIKVFILLTMSGLSSNPFILFLYWLLAYINIMLDTLIFILIVHAIGSWFIQDPYHPVQRFFGGLLFPVLAPLRQWIKPIGGILDITPMILLLAIYFLQLQLPSIINTIAKLIMAA